MKLNAVLLAGAAVCVVCTGLAANAARIVLNVGEGAQYQTIAAAVRAADADRNPSDYYVINVAPGTYVNDFPQVTRPMTIGSDPTNVGQYAILQATVSLPNEKGIILTVASLMVHGLVFAGAQIA